jgi:hypothetical protein
MSDEINYQALAAALVGQMGVTTKAVGSTPTSTYGHGPGGLFSSPGLSQPLLSAMALPIMGLQSVLPAYPSRDANPLYGIITGVTATSGNEPTGVCDDPPTSGLTKLCQHSFVFGRQSRMTRVFDIDRVGVLTNRGEFSDLRLINNPFGVNGTQANTPTINGFNASEVGQNELTKVLFEFATAWSRDFAKELYTGNPTNNSAGGGRKYFYGLDVLINTGYRDAETGTACPAADSIVRSFGSLEISTNGGTLVRTVTNIYRNLRYLASHAGLDPVEWVISMPWSLFYEVTEVWPCAYLSYRCQNNPTGTTNFIDATEQVKMRDDMRGNIFDRTGQYLLIDGQRVPVIVDEAISETVLAGESFTASMYFVPLTVLGNRPVTYMEHLPYDGYTGSPIDFANAVAPGYYRASDGGRFLWHMKPPTNFCVQMLAKTEPRLLMLTPYLAARLTSIKYTPLAHERSPFTDSSYFANGGGTDRINVGTKSSYYTPTA